MANLTFDMKQKFIYLCKCGASAIMTHAFPGSLGTWKCSKGCPKCVVERKKVQP